MLGTQSNLRVSLALLLLAPGPVFSQFRAPRLGKNSNYSRLWYKEPLGSRSLPEAFEREADSQHNLGASGLSFLCQKVDFS